MSAQSIAEVIEKLDEIIHSSIENNHTMGYFAALYRKVTIRVNEKLGTRYFDDDQRMENLDVVFANRYIDAYEQYMNHQSVSKVWEVAFKQANNSHLIVMQHLLLAMNAHINFDLGIATACVAGKNILSAKNDFYKINALLGDLLNEVQNDLIEIWSPLRLFLKWFKNTDDRLIHFSMKTARNGAWTYALELSHKKDTDSIKLRDEEMADIAHIILQQKVFIRFLLRLIRWSEKGDIAYRIRKLQD